MNSFGKGSSSTCQVLAIVFFLLLCGLGRDAAAQPPKPNLSGTWKLNGAKTQHPRWWHETRDYSLVIEQTEPKISIRRIAPGGNQTDSYLTDGKEHVTHLPRDGEELRAKTHWDGDTLVIESQRENGDFRTSIWTSRYELAQDGNTLRVSEHFLKSSSSNEPFDVIRTFERQPR